MRTGRNCSDIEVFVTLSLFLPRDAYVKPPSQCIGASAGASSYLQTAERSEKVFCQRPFLCRRKTI